MKPYHLTKRMIYFLIDCIEMSIAFLWEVFEYNGLIFFQYMPSLYNRYSCTMIISLIDGLFITFLICKYPSYIDSLYIQPPDNHNSSSQ